MALLDEDVRDGNQYSHKNRANEFQSHLRSAYSVRRLKDIF